MRTCYCGRPVFGTDKNTNIGYCSSHQWKRTDKKKKSIAPHTQRTPVRNLSFGFDDQLTMFEYLWEKARNAKGRVICQYTGEDITDLENGSVERWICCFAHVLPKGRYIYFKLNPDNVKVVHPNFHKAVDQGTTEIRKKWTGWKFRQWDTEVAQMKEKYLEYKKQNLLA